MLGRLIDGRSAEPGSLLLANADEFGQHQRILIIPLQQPSDYGCIMAAANGRIVLVSDARLRRIFWDVSSAAAIEIDYSQFQIGQFAPTPGDILCNKEGHRFLGVQHNERDPDEAVWVNLDKMTKAGEVVEGIRFPAWSIVHRPHPDRATALFIPRRAVARVSASWG